MRGVGYYTGYDTGFVRSCYGTLYQELIRRLYKAIPEKDKEYFRNTPLDTLINGGFVRSCNIAQPNNFLNVPPEVKPTRERDLIEGMVAAYNNTRANEQEIIDWFERARYV